MFLVAHFHNVIIGGVLFGAFAGLTYWFPKAFGFRLHEGWGKAAFWFTFIGFYATFVPFYVAGLMGMTRRLQHYDVPAWHIWMVIAGAGTLIIFGGVVCQVAQFVVSIRRRADLRDVTGDPWDGRSLEWSTPSPPPPFNFAVLPSVETMDDWWHRKQGMRQQRGARGEPKYQPLHMPRNSATGFICAFFATAMGFAMIWHIWWMVAVGFIGAWATFVVFAWREFPDYVIPADEVARIDNDGRASMDAFARAGYAE
jgi:cytochrome o ubiquinol oxidase subunit 1